MIGGPRLLGRAQAACASGWKWLFSARGGSVICGGRVSGDQDRASRTRNRQHGAREPAKIGEHRDAKALP